MSVQSDFIPPVNQNGDLNRLKSENNEHTKQATDPEYTGIETDRSSLVFYQHAKEKMKTSAVLKTKLNQKIAFQHLHDG